MRTAPERRIVLGPFQQEKEFQQGSAKGRQAKAAVEAALLEETAVLATDMKNPLA